MNEKVPPKFILLKKANKIESIRPKYFHFSYSYVASRPKNILTLKPLRKMRLNIFLENLISFRQNC